MLNSETRFNIATVLALISVPWADIHFFLAVVRAHQWWDIIPLAGMLILTYALGWLIHKLWTLRDQLPAFRNAMMNIATVFQVATEHPQGDEFYKRVTQPPEVFEREFRASMRRD